MACNKCPAPKKLTVGVPVYDDYRAAALTIQSVRLHGGVTPADLDVFVVDNHAGSPEGMRLREFCQSAGVRYVVCPTVGTAPPRDTIFSHATGEIVCVIDSHVLLEPGALSRLVAFADANPKSLDLWHGPLVYDPLKPNEGIPAMKPEWGDDLMFGRWAEPWTFSSAADDPPIEIPMHGMGLVACRKSAWVRSPAGLRGFGGCEGMIHERWRQLGRKVLCLPFLRWWHLFHRQAEPTKFPNTYEDRCRNYLIWAKSLSLDATEIIARFSARLGAERVASLMSDATQATAHRSEKKSIVRKAWNYAQAVAAHRLAGSPGVTEAEYRARLDQCDGCDKRIDNECVICGCPIEEKAKWREQVCPHPNGPRWLPLLHIVDDAKDDTGGKSGLPAAAIETSPIAAGTAQPTQRKKLELLDPATCPHDRLTSRVRIDRREQPPHVASLTVTCMQCGQRFGVGGEVSASFEIEPASA